MSPETPAVNSFTVTVPVLFMVLTLNAASDTFRTRTPRSRIFSNGQHSDNT